MTDVLDMKLWDFGGQGAYYDTHQMFLTKDALFILVVCMFAYSGASREDALEKWLDVLQSRLPGSVVLLVGTHSDCFADKEEHTRKVEQLKEGVNIARKRLEYESPQQEMVRGAVKEFATLDSVAELQQHVDFFDGGEVSREYLKLICVHDMKLGAASRYAPPLQMTEEDITAMVGALLGVRFMLPVRDEQGEVEGLAEMAPDISTAYPKDVMGKLGEVAGEEAAAYIEVLDLKSLQDAGQRLTESIDKRVKVFSKAYAELVKFIDKEEKIMDNKQRVGPAGTGATARGVSSSGSRAPIAGSAVRWGSGAVA
eukprot:g18834.t1